MVVVDRTGRPWSWTGERYDGGDRRSESIYVYDDGGGGIEIDHPMDS